MFYYTIYLFMPKPSQSIPSFFIKYEEKVKYNNRLKCIALIL
jgi:hypothetical protein